MSNEKALTLPEGRIAFAQFLFNPTDDERKGKPYWWCKIVIPKASIPKGSDGMNRILAARKAAMEGVFKDGKLPQGSWDILRDGDTQTTSDGEPIEEFKGCWVIKAKTYNKPAVYRKVNGKLVDIQVGDIKSGDWGAAAGVCYAYNNVQKGVGFYIGALLYTREGEAFAGGGGINADDAFAGHGDSQSPSDTFSAPAAQPAAQTQGGDGDVSDDDDIPF